MAANVETMFYTREKPWHWQGKVMKENDLLTDELRTKNNVRFQHIKVVKENKSIPHPLSLYLPIQAYEMVKPYYHGTDRAILLVCGIDTVYEPLYIKTASIGTLDSCLVSPREIFKAAILTNSTFLYLFHNHISGNPYPSHQDAVMTRQVQEAGRDNEAMRLGRDLEGYVAQRFTEAAGFKLKEINAILYHDKHPFMIADVDRMLVGRNIGLECKTASPYSSDKWADGQIPPHYQIQCHHYMAVTGAEGWYIAVLILGREFKYQLIERDEDIIESLIKIEKNFWKMNVLKKKAPEPDGTAVTGKWIKQHFQQSNRNSVMNLYGFDDKLQRRKEIALLLDKMEQEKEKIEQEIKMYMGESETAENETYQVSWKSYETSRVDTGLLKSGYPDIYKAVCRKTSSRKFMIKEYDKEQN